MHVRWEDLDNHFMRHHLEVVPIEGNGYCFLNSVLTCLLRDYGDTLTLEDCITKIVTHLCQHHRKYSDFHRSSSSDYAADQLISDALDFFRNGQFLADVVDLLMQITADALKLDIFIYQRSLDNIQALHFQHPKSDRVVRLKFTHNNLNPGGNHYDAIVRVSEPQSNLFLISDVASKMEKITPKSHEIDKIPSKAPATDIIDLTLTDDEESHQPTNIKEEPCNYDLLIGISSSPSQMPPPSKFLRPDTGHETAYSGSTENYSHSDETYISTDPDPMSSPSSTAVSTPASTPELIRKQYSPLRKVHRRRAARSIISSGTSSTTSDPPCEPLDEDFYMSQEFEANTLISQISRGRPFPMWYFDTKIPELIDAVPLDIDGTQFYRIKANKNEWHKVTRDLRHFNMVTSSREGFNGERRIGTCQGSFICNNDQCPFVLTSHNAAPNRVSWRYVRGRRTLRVCNICDQVAQREGCGARKVIEYDYGTHMATVYHLGDHRCSLQVDHAKRSRILKKRLEERNPTGSAKEVGLREVGLLIESGEMDMAAAEAENWVDRRAAKRQMENLLPTAGHDHNSFDAVGLIKRTTDTRDKYYIYKIGNRNLSGGSDYVFKSSKKMAEIAILMDVDGPENILQLENAYFDTTHTRVYGFKTLAMWLVHPAMKQILRLTSMEIRSENHTDIALFLRLFNEILSQVSGRTGYKFNPRYFVCDEGGANFKAIREVYGEEFVRQRVKGCQWHFKSDVRKHINKVGQCHRQRFQEICDEMCRVTTVAAFKELITELKQIADLYPDLHPFVKYWDLRKTHVFAPFRGGGLPGLNMSEPGNASFKPAGTMRLVHAAKYDVSSMMLQESQIDMFQRNLLPCSGRAPTKESRDAKDRAQQLRVAEDFVNIFNNVEEVLSEARQGVEPDSYLPAKTASHRAPAKKKETARARKAQAQKIDEPTDGQLTAQCIKAMTIMDCEVSPESKGNKIDNPPTIVRATEMIRRCRGCRGEIKPADKQYPHNMVFRRRGVVGYLNRVKNEWVESEQNIHFHMKLACLRKNDATIEGRYIATNDETFLWLDNEQMEWLHAQGFLKPIARKKCIM